MAIFPQQFFTKDNVLIRTGPPELRANYASSQIAEKFAGPAKGVYQGYTPSAIGGVLTLAIDGTEGFSLAKVHSNLDPAGMDVISSAPIAIDFSTAAPSDFQPDGVQVILKASYDADTAPTTAAILPRTKTTTAIMATIGGSPVVFDLSTLAALDPIKPGTLSITVNVQGSGFQVITDDGNGNLVGAVALPGGGTVNYATGKLTGITAVLAAASNVTVTYTRGVGKDEVLVCELTNASLPAAIVIAAVPGVTRDTPLAFPGTDFGFMPVNSVEELAAAVAILNEVIAARIDLQGLHHASLKERLDTDLGAPAMAFRLGRIHRVLQSNDYSAPGGVSEILVGDSFTETGRAALPLLTLNGGGSETVIGAITDPPDSSRNVCFLVNATTGDRLIADPITREVVFARLRQSPDFILDGTLNFVNALTTLSGTNNTKFVAQLSVGDLVQGPDGKFYAIANVTSDTAATLQVAFQGATASSGNLIRRRFRLHFRKFHAGAETDHALSATTPLRFFFPAFITHAQANFDNAVRMYAPGERPPVPDATTAVPGKVLLADPGSPFIGAINLRLHNIVVGGGPFHTLNFTGSPGALVELGSGIIDVTNIGPIGPQGPGAGPGPPGNPGPDGPSLTHISTFSPKPTEDNLGPGPGAVNISWSVDFGYQVKLLSGGLAEQNVPIGDLFFAGRDTCTITDIRLDSATVGTITGTGGSGGTVVASVLLYLDAAGTD